MFQLLNFNNNRLLVNNWKLCRNTKFLQKLKFFQNYFFGCYASNVQCTCTYQISPLMYVHCILIYIHHRMRKNCQTDSNKKKVFKIEQNWHEYSSFLNDIILQFWTHLGCGANITISRNSLAKQKWKHRHCL